MQLEHAIHIRSYPGSPRGGDVGVTLPFEGGAVLALVDATGHGLEAYGTAQTARRFLHDTPLREPDALLVALDEALRGSVGAAASIACIQGHDLTFAGIGNVAAAIDNRPLVVQPGMLGQRMRTPRVTRARLEPGALLVLRTDGVDNPAVLPHGSAQTIAKQIVALYGSEHDDAGVAVARWLEDRP